METLSWEVCKALRRSCQGGHQDTMHKVGSEHGSSSEVPGGSETSRSSSPSSLTS